MSIQIQQAWQLLQAGQYNEALKIAESACITDEADAESAYLQGCCLSQLGRFTEAIASFEQSLLYEPGAQQVHIAMASALLAKEDLEAAADSYKKVLLNDPFHLYALVGLARVHAAFKRYNAAKEQLHTAQKHNPESGLPSYELGILGRQLKTPAIDIHEYFQAAADIEPGIAKYQLALGECLLNQERHDEARKHLEKAYLIEPDNPYTLSGLASVSFKQGDMDFAFEQIDKLHKRGNYMPDVAVTYLLACKHANRCNEAIEYAKTCLNNPSLSPEESRNIHSKLASVLDNLKLYDEAWQHLRASKDVEACHKNYDPVGHKKYIDNLVEVFQFANMFNLPRANIEHKISPIFIIGMPRSGTSLVEQILAAHPEVTGGGELPYISSIMSDLPKLAGSSQSWPFCIKDISQQGINLCAQRYQDAIIPLAENKPYFTDKMPHNFYALGLIRLLYPKAKIIHCKRHLLDTCLSIYFQKFAEGHPYADDLFHLGTHYHQYLRIMEHWEKSLSFKMFEASYEDLVHNPEESVRKMLDFCELDWNDNCLNFNKIKRYVITASFDQVRQPMYTSSVNRWQHYEQYLNELKEGLDRGL